MPEAGSDSWLPLVMETKYWFRDAKGCVSIKHAVHEEVKQHRPVLCCATQHIYNHRHLFFRSLRGKQRERLGAADTAVEVRGSNPMWVLGVINRPLFVFFSLIFGVAEERGEP